MYLEQVMANHATTLHLASNLVKAKQLKINEISRFCKGSFYHCNLNADLSLLYTSQNAKSELNVKIGAYDHDQKEVLGAFTLDILKPKLLNFTTKVSNIGKTITYIQDYKHLEKGNVSWLITTKYVHDAIINLNITAPIKEIDNALSDKIEAFQKSTSFEDKEVLNQLTKKELEIVKAILSGHNRQYNAIMLNISASTYDTHLKNIRRKLELNSINELFNYEFLIHDYV
ncbi:MAG: hypothetical protein JXQ87_07290 [Bacteroidia bacterium]